MTIEQFKALFCCVVLTIPIWYVVGCNEGLKMQDQQKPPGEFGASDGVFTSHRSSQGRDLGGVSQRPGLSIHWAGSDRLDSSVRPIDVIRVTIDRIEAEQQTDLGSNRNAKAMVLLLQAISALEGEREDVDGIPIIR
jgi:hypothetical protein